MTAKQLKQLQARIKGMRICSQDNDYLPRRSPFAKIKTPQTTMKARLVHNSLFHKDFDPSLIDDDSRVVFSDVMGLRPNGLIAFTNEDFDRRFHRQDP